MTKPDYGVDAPGVVRGLMLLYERWGKFRHRDRMLERVSWRGDERVLDVGTGRGLLMIGAAKRLRTGAAVGIDAGNATGLFANARDSILANAEAEAVREKVDVESMDAREMTFANDVFDVVLSNLGLHDIGEAEGRRRACHEIARVLKPGGVALVSDFLRTREYEAAFREAGLSTTRTGPHLLDTFFPLWVVRAEKGLG